MKKEFLIMLQTASDAILEFSGIFNQPGPGKQAAGFSRTGQQVFTLVQLASSNDGTAGEQFAHAYAAIISPFGVFKKKEWDYLSYLAAASKAPKLLAALDKLYTEKKGETFAATILKAVKTGHRHALGAVAAIKIYNNWGIMSPAQKAIAIVMLGGQTYLIEPGKALCDLKIVDGKDQTFLVSDALTLLGKGKNPYALVENWNQIRNLCRVYNPTPSLDALIDFAEGHNLLSKSPRDSAVPGVTKKQIQSVGAKPAPQYGVGAVAAPPGANPPQGYSSAAQTQGAHIMVPTANARSAQGALQGSLLGTKGGAGGISSDALGIYQNWNKDEKLAEDKGAEGGSALLAGLNTLKQQNPYLYAAMIAFFTHYAGAYPVSSTPSEYFATLAGIALARLVAGKKDYKTDAEGAQIAKTVQAQSPADFAKLQTMVRGIYASFRVKSKADAYQLSNQAYAEERINESDLTAMHEIFDILYGENGLAATQKLMNGKDAGMKIAADKAKGPVNTMTEQHYRLHAKILADQDKQKTDDVRARNRAKFQAQQAQQQQQPAQPDDSQQEGQEPQQPPDQAGAEAETPGPQGPMQPPGQAQLGAPA